MKLNTDMSKSILTVIALAAILSLSLFVKVYAESGGNSDQKTEGIGNRAIDTTHKDKDDPKPHPIIISSFPDTADNFKKTHGSDDKKCPIPDAGRCSQAIRAPPSDDGSGGNNKDNNRNKVDSGSSDYKKIHEINSLFSTNAKTPKATATTVTSTTVQNGLNATFFDVNTPYCWYVVNAPPCYDIKTGTVIR